MARRIRERDPSNWPAWWREIRLAPDAAAREVIRKDLEVLSAAAGSPADRAGALALLAHLAEDDASAEVLVSRALEESPLSGIARAVWARRLEQRGDHAKAFAEWRAAAVGHSPPDWMWQEFAASAERNGDLDWAWTALDRCVEVMPDDFRAHYNLGTLALERDQPGRAYELLARAHELAPADLDVLLNFATASTRNGRTDQAKQLLEDALRLNPDDAEVHFNLGVFFADHVRDRERAIQHFRRYLEITGEPSLRVERWISELEGKDK